MAPTDHLGRELDDSTEGGPQTVSEFAEQNPDPSPDDSVREALELQRERREDAVAAERGEAAAQEQSRDGT